MHYCMFLRKSEIGVKNLIFPNLFYMLTFLTRVNSETVIKDSLSTFGCIHSYVSLLTGRS